FELVADVGHVGGEVEVRTVLRPDERTILVVAVCARPRPERSFRFVGVELRQNLWDVLFDVPLMTPTVDGNPKLRDLLADLVEHVLDRVDVELGELVDVLTLIAALGRLFAASPRFHRGPKELHLPAGVAEVRLTLVVGGPTGKHP